MVVERWIQPPLTEMLIELTALQHQQVRAPQGLTAKPQQASPLALAAAALTLGWGLHRLGTSAATCLLVRSG